MGKTVIQNDVNKWPGILKLSQNLEHNSNRNKTRFRGTFYQLQHNVISISTMWSLLQKTCHTCTLVMISHCLCLKVFEQVCLELLFKAVTIESEKTLQPISKSKDKTSTG